MHETEGSSMIERTDIDAITIDPSHRKSDWKVVQALAESMRQLGMLQPILVYDDDGIGRLISGRHRLEAARSLGWEFVDAVFVDGDSIDLRLREIAENLHRAELTVQERSDQIVEWAELVEQKKKLISVQVAQKKPKRGRPNGGEVQTARELNLTREAVRRAKKIASISREAKEAAKEAGIDDNQSRLLAVASEPQDKQVAKVREFNNRSKQSVVATPKESEIHDTEGDVDYTFDELFCGECRTHIEQDEGNGEKGYSRAFVQYGSHAFRSSRQCEELVKRISSEDRKELAPIARRIAAVWANIVAITERRHDDANDKGHPKR
jgi:ParB/RepB/Spo0J family partition protein